MSVTFISTLFLIAAEIEIDLAIGSPLTIIMRKVKEISSQLANQLKKSLIELPNSSVSLSAGGPSAEDNNMKISLNILSFCCVLGYSTDFIEEYALLSALILTAKNAEVLSLLHSS